MTGIPTPAPAGLDAVRLDLFAPVASFRDPMFPGVARCLPVPPPSALRGMFAAATGAPAEPVPLGFAASAAGGGIDAETYHPVASDGTNPAVAGRVRAVKGGAVLKERPFLAHLRVTVWIPEPDGSRIAEALRCPVWPIRLGRSQDLVHLRSVRPVRLEPAGHAVVGHALAPPGAHPAGTAITVRLTRFISTDRLTSTYGDYLWCPEPAGRMPVTEAFHDGGHAVWLDPDPLR